MDITAEDEDEGFMRQALAQARLSSTVPGSSPIGCVIVIAGEIVAAGFNEVDLFNDPTAHAEIVTIRRLGETLRRAEFREATLYCTLEPCGMCAMASLWAKISRIVYGAGRDDVHGMYFEDRHLHAVDFIRDAFRDDIVMLGGILRAECAALYAPPDADIPPEDQVNL